MSNLNNTEKKRYDVPIIIASMLLVVAMSGFFLFFPDQSVTVANKLFSVVTKTFGTPILWYAFGLVIIAAFLIFSKFGNIRFGNEKPDYSTFSYIAMMACAGVGSGTIYWAFLEWSYYIKTPAFNIVPFSPESFEWAVTYSLHHWGITAWAIYCITALPVLYSFYIKKNKSLRLSDITRSIIGEKAGKPIGRIIDCLYPFACIAGLIIVIALGVPVISAAVSLMFGITDGLLLKIGIILIVTAIYTISSFFGIEKGMQKISSSGTYFIIALVLYVLLMGPTQFILDNTSSSIALWIQNYTKMSIFTDAIGGKGFPQGWTAYFWAYWMIFIPMMCVFVARVSKGRTVKEVILCMMGGGTLGIVTLFSIVGSFMMKTEMDGKVIVTQMVSDGNASYAISEALNTLPMAKIVMGIFVVATFLLLATTLDSSAFSIACNTQLKLDKDGNPSRFIKIFWCLALVTIPTVFIIVGAPVSAMQSCIIAFALPILILTVTLLYGMFKWMKQDYGPLTAQEIIDKHKIEK